MRPLSERVPVLLLMVFYGYMLWSTIFTPRTSFPTLFDQGLMLSMVLGLLGGFLYVILELEGLRRKLGVFVLIGSPALYIGSLILFFSVVK